LLFEPGAGLAGSVEVVDIGLSCDHVRVHLVQQADVAEWFQPRVADSHKWSAATRIIAGSAGMTGAAYLAASAAQRTGAGMVHLSVPGAQLNSGEHEYVQRPFPATNWAKEATASLDRFQSLVIGPGLGRDEATVAAIRTVVQHSPVPTVVDGDGLFALAWSTDGAASALREREAPTVLTPHDGEFALLAGAKVGPNRIMETRLLAFELNVVVLLKGPATVVADPDGRVLVVTAGDERLATAGTGDVLSGVIGALLAHGIDSFEAAAAGAWIHGRAGRLGARRGLIASDLLALIPQVLDSLA
jgi:NAD(P)H-hydrate epimerase